MSELGVTVHCQFSVSVTRVIAMQTDTMLYLHLQLTSITFLAIWYHQPARVQADSIDSDPAVLHIVNHEHSIFLGPVTTKESHNITIVGDDFVLDGQTLHIISGSLHYFRLPAVYWKDRLQKLKAAGLNAVATYVEWSYHEPEERQYLFDGNRNIAQFVQTAAEVGLHVLLRPGPYICAERDLGGIPYWLLGKYPGIKLRTTDKDFINETKIWMAKLFTHISPLLFGNGGPIILVQVENEYGSYGSDQAYKEQIRNIIKQHVGDDALLYTTDGSARSLIVNGAVDGALTTIDFGVGSNVKKSFKTLREFMPYGPLMNSEFYPGWLTHWGESFQQVPTDPVVTTMRNMLDNKIHFNFYMFFGGSNFEFTAGANYGGTYQPDITSYDYDAPLSEAGDPTNKYIAIRNALEKYNPHVKDIPLPTPAPKGAYGPVKVAPRLRLLSVEGRSILGKKYEDVQGTLLPTFEKLRQRSGLILYETTLTINETDGLLSISRPRDRIYVYVDGILQGVLSRMHKIYSLPLKSNQGSILSLLVENQGRINYGSLLHDYKGILSEVKYNNHILDTLWSIIGYPLETLHISDVTLSHSREGPILYETYFQLPEGQQPLDTFINTDGWGKGYIWINGNNLGRYWPNIGPQVTMYVPGVWLKAAPVQNHLQILELEEASSTLDMNFIDYPILNRTAY